MRKLLVALVLGFAAAVVTAAEKPLKVLMIGNSFSVQMVRAMPPVTADLGLNLDIVSMYIGGCPLSKHVKNVADPTNKPYSVTWHYDSLADQKAVPFASLLVPRKEYLYANIPEMLKSDAWDVVTVQQASHESWQPQTYVPWGDELVKTIRALAPQAKIVVQETWSYTPWDKRLATWKITPEEMYAKLHDAYAIFAGKYGFEVIPTGTAVQAFRRELPVKYTEKSFGGDVCGNYEKGFEEKDGKWQPVGDRFHMNDRGNHLQALVWTARLFKADVTKGAFVPDCLKDEPETAKLMRKIAVDVCAAK